MVRLGIAPAVEGRSWESFGRDVARSACCGGDFGIKYRNTSFASQVIAMAAMAKQREYGVSFNAVLPGLGIPGDFAVAADGVPLGAGGLNRHGELLVICLGMVSPETGVISFPLHSAPEVPLGGKKGPGAAAEILAALESHPAHWPLPICRARMAGAGGDGAMTVGGGEPPAQVFGRARQTLGYRAPRRRDPALRDLGPLSPR